MELQQAGTSLGSINHTAHPHPSAHLSDNIAIGAESLFPAGTESLYLSVLWVLATLSIPAHALVIWAAAFRTPREMVNYRLTVTNTSAWSLAIAVHGGLLFRPVPLFPLPMVKVAGVVRLLGPFYGGSVQLVLFMFLVTNFLTAAIICFCVICVFLLQKRKRLLSRRTGVKLAVGIHVVTSGVVVGFFSYGYKPLMAGGELTETLVAMGLKERIDGIGEWSCGVVRAGRKYYICLPKHTSICVPNQLETSKRERPREQSNPIQSG